MRALASSVPFFAVVCGAAAKLACHEILVPFRLSAQNQALPANFSAADLTPENVFDAIPKFPKRTIAGEFKIGARYCEPSVRVRGREGTLQVLVHGATYTRNYWSGLAAPGTKPGQDEYSWIEYAASQGYATLSVDRLCNGESSHPDGVTACQFALEGEALRAIINAARAGKLPCTPKAYKKIIAVGHSAGSATLNQFSQRHPSDVDALILTGFSFNLRNGLAGFANQQIDAAAKLLPDRFGDLPPSYLATGSENGTRANFYYGDFDESVAHYDFINRGTVTVGENAGLGLNGAAPGFKGPLFVLNGENDAIFCALEPTIDPEVRCSAGYSHDVHRFYPAASKFGYYNTPNTGHCLNLHRTARESYAAAHRFLREAGY